MRMRKQKQKQKLQLEGEKGRKPLLKGAGFKASSMLWESSWSAIVQLKGRSAVDQIATWVLSDVFVEEVADEADDDVWNGRPLGARGASRLLKLEPLLTLGPGQRSRGSRGLPCLLCLRPNFSSSTEVTEPIRGG